MTGIGISALGLCLPSGVRTNAYYEQHPSEAVQRRLEVGIGKIWQKQSNDAFSIEMEPYANDPFRGSIERRVMREGQKLIELETQAARNALQAANMSAGDIDAMIVTSFVPETVGAGNAAYLAKELGFTCPAWNLESACSSTIVAFEVAHAYVKSGRYRNVMIIQGCNYSQHSDDEDSSSWFLGDGAGAFIVSPVSEGGFVGFGLTPTTETCGAVRYRVDGPNANGPCFVLESAPGAGKILHATSEPYLVKTCERALNEAGLSINDIGFGIFSTPTAWYATFCARVLGLSREKTISTHQQFGNMGPAMTAANLYAALKEHYIKAGDAVLFYQVGSVSNAGAAVVRWGECGAVATEM